MNKKRLVIIFFSIFFISYLGLVKTIESKMFAQYIYKKINKVIQKEIEADIEFENIKLSFTPAGVSFKNFKLKKNILLNDEKSNISLVVSNIKFVFSIKRFFFGKSYIDKIIISDGDLLVDNVIKLKNNDFKKNNDFNFKEILEIFFEKIDGYSKKYCNHFELKKFKFSDKQNSIYFDNFIFKLINKDIQVIGSAFDINIPELSINNLTFQELTTNISIKKTEIEIDKIILRNVENKIELSGNLDFQNIDKPSMNIFIKGLLNHDLLKIVKKDNNSFNDIKGYLNFESKIYGYLFDPEVMIKGSVIDLESKYIVAEKINFNLELKNKILKVLELNYKLNNQYIGLTNSVSIFDFESKKVISQLISLKIKDLESKNLFKFLDGDLDPLLTKINGNFEILLEFGKKINIKLKNEGVLNDFMVVTDSGKKVISYQSLSLNDFKIDVLFSPLSIHLDLKVKKDDSLINLQGNISKNELNFYLNESLVDLNSLTPLMEKKILGSGKIECKVVSKASPGDHKKKTIFYLDLKELKNFNILDLNLGEVNGHIEFALESSLLKIINAKINNKKTIYTVDGEINFLNDRLNLDINFISANYQDLLYILQPLTNNFPYWLKEFDGTFKTKLKISGKTSIPKLEAEAEVLFSQLTWRSEEFDNGRLKFSFKNNKISISNFIANKSSGKISGDFEKEMNSDKNVYSFQFENINLKNIEFLNKNKFGAFGIFNGLISSFEEVGTQKGVLNLSLKSASKNTFGEVLFNFESNWPGPILNFKVDWPDVGIFGNGKINLGQNKNEKNSFVELSGKEVNLKKLFVLFDKHNLKNKSLGGSFNFQSTSTFNINSFDLFDLNFEADDVFFINNEKKYSFEDNVKVLFKNGTISSFSQKIIGPDLMLNIQSKGHLGKNFEAFLWGNFPSELLELVSSKIQKIKGQINTKLSLTNSNKTNFNLEFNASGNNLSGGITGLKGRIDDFTFSTVYKNNRLYFNEAKGSFGGGSFELGGNILFVENSTKFDVDYKLERTKIQLFKNSFALLTGKGNVKGDHPPYKISGPLLVEKGEIRDEFNKTADSEKNKIILNRFIPELEKKADVPFFELDLVANISSGVLVKNTTVDLYLKGILVVNGSFTNPNPKGVLFLQEGQNKLFVNNNEFIFSRGELKFLNEGKANIIELNFDAQSIINEYKVLLSVYGNTDDFMVDISSDPPLEKRDILSLLTLGMTSSMSKNLSESEKQALASMSFGSYIVDKFKFKQGLKSSLGFNLTLAPEYFEDNQSPLSSNTSTSKNSRYKAGTKVKIDKALTKSLDLGISSSVAGSVTPKQEMNLNYALKNNLSIESVYEIKNGQTKDESSSSLGADIKWKWTFK